MAIIDHRFTDFRGADRQGDLGGSWASGKPG